MRTNRRPRQFKSIVAIVTINRFTGRPAGPLEGVIPVPTEQGVGSSSTIKKIRSIGAIKGVVIGATPKDIILCTTVQYVIIGFTSQSRRK